MSGGIFVSYRKNHNGVRRPHAQTIEAIVDHLQRHFGREKVLVDMELKAGDHYPSTLRGWLAKCEVVLVIVHREWFDDLKARKGEELDWVRWEVSEALEQKLQVVPVLLDGARLPGKDQLIAAGFPELAQLSTRQYQPIGFGAWKEELAELLRVLEEHVAVADLPPAERPGLVRRKHFWLLLAAVATAGLLVPWIVARTPAAQGQPEIALIAMSIAMSISLVPGLLVVAANYAVRRLYDRYDVLFAEFEPNSKISVGLAVGGIALILFLVGKVLPFEVMSLIVLVTGGFAFVRGHRWFEEGRRARWPYPILWLRPDIVRIALAQAGRLVAQRDPLTRTERDQVEFVLGQVEWALQRLEVLSLMSRWAWFRRSETLAPAAYLLIPAFVVGSAAMAVVEGAFSGYWPLIIGSVVFGVCCYLLTVELAFRLQRWQRQAVVKDLPDRVEQVRARLAETAVENR